MCHSLQHEMCKMHREVLRNERMYLLRNVKPTEELWSALFQERVLSEEMMNEIKVHPTSQQQVGALLDLLPARGPKAFQAFCDALRECEHPHVNIHLQQCVEGPHLSWIHHGLDGKNPSRGSSHKQYILKLLEAYQATLLRTYERESITNEETEEILTTQHQFWEGTQGFLDDYTDQIVKRTTRRIVAEAFDKDVKYVLMSFKQTLPHIQHLAEDQVNFLLKEHGGNEMTKRKAVMDNLQHTLKKVTDMMCSLFDMAIVTSDEAQKKYSRRTL